MPLGEISQKEKLRPISHEKKTNLGKNCVTMTYLMVKFNEKTELSDVICGECSKSSGKTSKANFETKQSVLKPPMLLRIFTHRPWKKYKRDEYCKNKTNIALPAQYSMYFPSKDSELLYIIVYINTHIGKDMDKGKYVCDVLDYNTVTWWDFYDDTITQYPGYPMHVYDELLIDKKEENRK